MRDPDNQLPNSELASHLARLWPHRACEANILLGQLCRVGLHWWRHLDLSETAPGRDIHFCFSCTKIKIDGTIYEPNAPGIAAQPPPDSPQPLDTNPTRD